MADDLRGDLELGPVKARIEIGLPGIAVPNLRRLIAGRRILAGFAEQDLAGAFGREAMGHDRARRAAADDDGVVHVMLPPGSLPGKLAHLGAGVTPAVAQAGRRYAAIGLQPLQLKSSFASST